jgi:hypothetical protein
MAKGTRKKDAQGTGSAAQRQPSGQENQGTTNAGSTPPEKYRVSRDEATHGVEDRHGEKRNTM